MIREQKFTYSELRDLATKDGVNDNIVAIGMWLKKNGYTKHHYTDKSGKSFYFYTHDTK